MSKIDWSKEYLGDIGVTRKLESLNKHEKCEVLDLSYNNLSCIPDLKKYRQFDSVKVLVLRKNCIRDIDLNVIPPTLTELQCYGNQLSAIGDITHCIELKVLNLNWNEISQVDWRNLPPTLTELNLYKNQLATV